MGRQDKAKSNEKADFMCVNEHFEEGFNAVLSSAIVFQPPAKYKGANPNG
jgi:hypothetical protein